MDKIQSQSITLGIFFDGTGNNGYNTDLGINHPAAGSSVSYANDHSNIYRLYQRHETASINNHSSQYSIYIEGIGTAKGQPDNILPDMAFGTGDRGVLAKVQQSLTQITRRLGAFADNIALTNSDAATPAIIFDLFGFSRGAAAARHLANLLFEDIQNPQVAERLCLNQQTLAPFTYAIRFLGLFDSVAAIALPSNGMSCHSANVGELMLHLPAGIADQVFHLVAEHECRYNFPLSSVKPHFNDFNLPGSHSDVGGGYQKIVDEDLLLSYPAYETLPDSHSIDETALYRKILREKAQLEAHELWGNMLQHADVSLCLWQRPTVESKRLGMMKQAAVALRVQRQVKNGWARVALQAMLHAATEAGCLFDIQGINDEIPPLLNPAMEHVLAQISASRRGECAISLNAQHRALIAREYIHCSAHWGEVMQDAAGTTEDSPAWPVKPFKLLSFINRPDENWQRTVMVYSNSNPSPNPNLNP